MTTLDELRMQIQNANETINEPQSVYHDIARKIVNIERQSYYGKESSVGRLGKIREAIVDAVKQGEKNED